MGTREQQANLALYVAGLGPGGIARNPRPRGHAFARVASAGRTRLRGPDRQNTATRARDGTASPDLPLRAPGREIDWLT